MTNFNPPCQIDLKIERQKYENWQTQCEWIDILEYGNWQAHRKNSTRWYKNGQLHREDGPAVEWVDGSKEWFIDGKHHRENGPAIEWDDGKREWYLNGVRHRENGPAVEYPDGKKQWYLNGKLERVEFPAKEIKTLREKFFGSESLLGKAFKK